MRACCSCRARCCRFYFACRPSEAGHGVGCRTLVSTALALSGISNGAWNGPGLDKRTLPMNQEILAWTCLSGAGDNCNLARKMGGVYMAMASPSHYAEAAVAHFVPPMVCFICCKILKKIIRLLADPAAVPWLLDKKQNGESLLQHVHGRIWILQPLFCMPMVTGD